MAKNVTLSKAPVVDAIVELRFDSKMPSQVVAGLLFNKLAQYGYDSFEELPIAQLPQQVKDTDEKFRYAAHYRIKSDKYFVSISSRVISIVCKCVGGSKYQGWVNYRQEVEKVLGEFQRLDIADIFSRVGVRYVNLFDKRSISESINIAIEAPSKGDFTDEQVVGFVYKNDGMLTRINFATKANMSFAEGENMSGAVLDIDTYVEQEIEFDNILEFVENGHAFTEAAFTSILKPEFLRELK